MLKQQERQAKRGGHGRYTYLPSSHKVWIETNHTARSAKTKNLSKRSKSVELHLLTSTNGKEQFEVCRVYEVAAVTGR